MQPRIAALLWVTVAITQAGCNAVLGIDERPARPAAASGVGATGGQGGSGAAGAAAGGAGGSGGSATPGAVRWVKQFGSSVDAAIDGLALTADGKILVVVDHQGSLELAGTPLNALSQGQYDIALVTLEPADGAFVDARSIGGAANEFARHVAVSSTGVIALIGGYEGAPSFGVGMPAADLDRGAFLLVLSSQGAPMFVLTFSGMGLADGTAVAFDSAGSIIVAGTMGPELVVGGQTYLSVGAGHAIWAAKVTAAGNVAWVRIFPGLDPPALGAPSAVTGLVVDNGNTGNTCIVGGIDGRHDLFFGPQGTTGDQDAFVISLTTIGAPLWVRTWPATFNQLAMGIARDASAWVVAGAYIGTVDFGTGPLTSDGQQDMFVLTFDDVGATQQAWVYGDSYVEYPTSQTLAVSSAGTRYVAGVVQGPSDLGAGALPFEGGFDILAHATAPDGTVLWNHTFGGTGIDAAQGALLTPAGLAISGAFEATMTIGNQMLSAVAPQGFHDGVVIMLEP